MKVLVDLVNGLRQTKSPHREIPWRPYAAAMLLVAAASLLGAVLLNRMAPTNLVMLFLLVVVVTGLRWGRGPAVVATILGVLAFDFFLVPPVLSFTVSDAQYLFTFTALLIVALVIGTLTGQLRDRAAALNEREQETAALYAFSSRMVAVRETTEIGRAIVEHVNRSFGRAVGLLLHERGALRLLAGTPDFELTAHEGALAATAHAQEHAVEFQRETGQGAHLACIPLRTPHGTIGVLVVKALDGTGKPSVRHRRLLEAFAAQGAVVLERALLAEAARRDELIQVEEKLHDALLHSISHALRTPLASIIGSLETVAENGAELDAATRGDLIETAREEAERLNWLVSNLLDMTRLEAGHLRLNIDWHDFEDVIGVTLAQTANKLAGAPVRVDLEDGLPLVALDLVLIVQVLDNLLHNAAKYSPPGSPIDLTVRRADGMVEVQVADRGVGISDEHLVRVFEKFYRVQRPGAPYGTGLGLAISKGMVEAHGGTIWASQREGGGTVMSFRLPIHPLRESEVTE